MTNADDVSGVANTVWWLQGRLKKIIDNLLLSKSSRCLIGEEERQAQVLNEIDDIILYYFQVQLLAAKDQRDQFQLLSWDQVNGSEHRADGL